MTPGAAGLFAGRYAILEKLGSGGFGTVYRAHDQHLRIEVALKVTNSTVTDPLLLQRFEREARVIAKLHHENITKIFDFGVHEGTPFFAMEFVPGDSLQRVLELNRVLAPRAAARIVRDVALALHHAHLAGVVHRDVKPHNILVQPRESAPSRGDESISSSRGVLSDYRVVLTDFGLAKDAGAQTKVSVTGEVMGTPHFMPPEQAMGESAQIGPPADVYSLGVTLYVLLCGRFPFEGNSFPEILANIITTEARPLRHVAPGAPADLCAIVQKATEREIPQRYSSALALAQDCESFLKGDPISAKPPAMLVKMRRVVRRHPALCASAVSAVLVALAALGYFALYVPWRAVQAAQESMAARRVSFVAEKARVEREAGEELQRARGFYAGGEFEKAARVAEGLVTQFGAYARSATFPRNGGEAGFESMIPFGVPVVEAHLLTADAYERRQLIPEATRYHLKAYFAGSEGGDSLATFELAHFFLRSRKFAEAVRFFRKAARQGSRWAPYALGFALAGAGRFDDAARAFEAAKPPADFPLRREFCEGELVPLYSLPPGADVVAEALHLCALFGGRRALAERADGAFAIADLEGDGKDDVIVGTTAGVDVIGLAGARHLEGPNLQGATPVAADFDGDGRPELLFAAQGGFRLFAVDGGILRLLADVSTEKGPKGESLWVKSVAAADINGDGNPEILMHAHQAFRIYRRDGGGWRLAGLQQMPATDVADMFVRDLDGDGKREVVMVSGTWGPQGFRAWIYNGDDVMSGRQVTPRSTPIGRTSSAFQEIPGTTAYLFTTCVWDLDVRTQNFVYGQLGLERLQGLCKVTAIDGTFGAPQLVWGRRVDAFSGYWTGLQPIVERDRSYALVHLATEGELRVIRLTDPAWSYLPLDVSEARAFKTADLDGDGDRELVEWRDGTLFARGLGRAAPAADAESAADAVGNARSIAFQDAILGVAIYRERGREEEAAHYLEELIAPFPEFEKELRLRAADCWQSLRRWDRLVESLARLRSTVHLPAAESAALDRRARWARELLEMRETVALEFAADETMPLLTNAPLKFRLDAGSLRAFSNSVSPAFLAVPLESDERSQLLVSRFKLHQFDYAATFAVGVSDSLDRFGTVPHENWARAFTMATGGAGGRQGVALTLSAEGRAGTGSVATVANPPLIPDGAPLMLAVEYAREAGVLHASLGRGGAPVAQMKTEVEFQNPPHAAFLVIRAGGGGMAGDGLWGELEIDRVAVLSAGGTVAGAWKPRTIRDLFLRGGGRFVRGDFGGAIEDYEAVLRAVDAKGWDADEYYGQGYASFVRTISFTLAFAERAGGRKAQAEARLARLFETEFREILLLVKRNHAAFSEAERTFLRGVFWKALERTGLEEALAHMRDAVTIAPSGGLPVYETLFFIDAPDTAPATHILGNLERLSSQGDPRLISTVKRLRARLLKMEGRHAEAIAALEEARLALDHKDLDEFDGLRLKRAADDLLRSWKSE